MTPRRRSPPCAALALAALAACGDDRAGAVDAAGERPWATYVIEPGAHAATVEGGAPGSPIDGFTGVIGRDYELVLDPSAIYTLTTPTDPADQLDWNKLPGLSDCGEIDLARDGLMLGWRWRLDLTPPVLEVTAYANNAGVHLTPAAPLFTLDAADLEARAPLRYRLWREAERYQVAVEGRVRGRPIAAAATLPRRCTAEVLDPLAWAAGLWFGGTSTAPQRITARIREATFVAPAEP